MDVVGHDDMVEEFEAWEMCGECGDLSVDDCTGEGWAHLAIFYGSEVVRFVFATYRHKVNAIVIVMPVSTKLTPVSHSFWGSI